MNLHYVLKDIFQHSEVTDPGVAEPPPVCALKRGDQVNVAGSGPICFVQGEPLPPRMHYLFIEDLYILVPGDSLTNAPYDEKIKDHFLVNEPPTNLNVGDTITLKCVSDTRVPDRQVQWEEIERGEELQTAEAFAKYLREDGLVWVQDDKLRASSSR